MKPIKLKINTKTQKYSIIIGSNLGSNVLEILRENSINFDSLHFTDHAGYSFILVVGWCFVRIWF